MSAPTSVPAVILNHPVFQQMLGTCPVGPIPLYQEFLSQADGSPSRLKQILDEYPARIAAIPRVGQGIGIQRRVSLEYGVVLVLTYVAINTLPQYLVEMTVQPHKHTVLDSSGTIHGVISSEETLTAINGVYYLAVNQGFRVRVRGGTTGYFTIPEPPY